MARRWFISDTHFYHKNIIKFMREDGNKLRNFDTVEEMNELIITNWNNKIKSEDTVVHIGDFSICNRSKFREVIERLNGDKVLIKGNHDEYDLNLLSQYFRDIRSFHKPSNQKIIFTHIPIHPLSLKGSFINVHGHLHDRVVLDENGEIDYRYLNISIEHTNYEPLSIEEVIEKANIYRDIAYPTESIQG